MLTEYNHRICNALIKDDIIELWRYTKTDGFIEKTTNRGRKYYEKVVNQSEIKDFLTVSFSTIYNNEKITIKSFCNNQLTLISNDREFAELYNFYETERGVWIKNIPLDIVDVFYMNKYIINNNSKMMIEINKEEFINMWRIYKCEV